MIIIAELETLQEIKAKSWIDPDGKSDFGKPINAV